MSLPSATTRLRDESGGLTTGTDLVCVWAPVATNDDMVPRLFAQSQGIFDFHGYSPGLDYAALHMARTGKPVMFIGLPIDTPATVGRKNAEGNTGTSSVDVVTTGDGSLEECEGILEVVTGGTIGTDQIILSLSLDGGRSTKTVRLGTASSYTIPYVGQQLTFGAGTLVAGDTILTWTSEAPTTDAASVATAKTNLANQQKKVRSWMYLSTLEVAGDITAIQSAVNGYETADERYCVVKCQVRKRLPDAEMSRTIWRMTGNPSLTFASAGDTITRSAGSWSADGFVNGDRITIGGTTSNDWSDIEVTVTSDTVLTTVSQALVDEGPVADVSLTGSAGITFATAGDTITRNRGSWLDDGFRDGDTATVTGTASNDGSIDVTTATALVLTCSTNLTDEGIGAVEFTLTAGETASEYVANMDAAFATVDGQKRVDIGLGHLAMLSPVTAWKFRRSVQWSDSIRSYMNDIRTTTWWKALGPLDNADMNDADGVPYEHDERTIGGALAAKFTCARTWGNGPQGAFIAQSLTRATDGSILGFTHNMFVASLAQTVVQQTTENFAGQTIVLEPADETGKRVATTASLREFEGKVNSELIRYLLSNIGGDGPRASVAKWVAATDDDLGIVDAVLNGTLTLELNGTITHIATAVAVK